MTETTANGIVKWTNSDPSSIVQESQAQGDSIELALSKRERFDFVWANSAERTAQTGMVQGSRGYQIDTKTEYLYDSSNWRLTTPYAEFNASGVVVASSTWVNIGTPVIDATLSTSTTFASASAGGVTLVDPGIYQILVYSTADAAISGVAYNLMTFVDQAASPGDTANQIARGPFASDNVSSNIAIIRTSASNTKVWMFYRHTSGANRTIGCRVRVVRLG